MRIISWSNWTIVVRLWLILLRPMVRPWTIMISLNYETMNCYDQPELWDHELSWSTWTMRPWTVMISLKLWDHELSWSAWTMRPSTLMIRLWTVMVSLNYQTMNYHDQPELSDYELLWSDCELSWSVLTIRSWTVVIRLWTVIVSMNYQTMNYHDQIVNCHGQS